MAKGGMNKPLTPSGFSLVMGLSKLSGGYVIMDLAAQVTNAFVGSHSIGR